MYANGYEPRIGDKVRRLTPGIMKVGEEGVVTSVHPCKFAAGNVGLRIQGCVDQNCHAEYYYLLSRAVRYADGNDAAVGDLVECVSAGDMGFDPKVGDRLVSFGPDGCKESRYNSIVINDQGHTRLSDRFKLIARACPYKVGDWVHYGNLRSQGEFQVAAMHYVDFMGWRIRDTADPMVFNDMYAKDVKPGRMPPQPAPQPLSVADEVRAIIDIPVNIFAVRSGDDMRVNKLVELIDAKTERLEKLVLELNRKIVNQRDDVARHQKFIHFNADYKVLYENLRNKLREVAE